MPPASNATTPADMVRDDRPNAASPAPRRPNAADVRGARTTSRDLSEHRRFTWLYDDLLS